VLRHIVLIQWVDGMAAEQVERVSAALGALPAQIDTIRAYTFGQDLRLGEGRWDFGIVGDFDDVDGWRTYDRHPLHDQARAEEIVPYVASRASVQFDLG
jgi:hypothetical protein